MMWRLENGDEVWFRAADAEVRGIEWHFINYTEAGPLDGEAIARLESYKRPPTGGDAP
jgi:hypothetical protein